MTMDIQSTDARTGTYAFLASGFTGASKAGSFDTIIDRDHQGKITIDGVTLGTGDLAFKDRAHPDVPSWETTNDAFRLSAGRAGRIATVNRQFASVPA